MITKLLYNIYISLYRYINIFVILKMLTTYPFNSLSGKCRAWTKAQTTSAWNWKVISNGEAGRRGARWHEVTFTHFNDFSTLKGSKKISLLEILYSLQVRFAKQFSSQIRFNQKDITNWWLGRWNIPSIVQL